MHTNHFTWKFLLNNFLPTNLNLVAYFFSISLFNRLAGSTPCEPCGRYFTYKSFQSSSCISLFSTSAWFKGIIDQVLQSLYSSLTSLAISGQKTSSLCNLLCRATSRFTLHILWCNLCSRVSPFCLKTHLISNPFAPLKNKFPLILKKSFMFDGRFDPISIP